MTVQATLQRDVDLREQNARLKDSLDKASIDIGNLQTELTAALRRVTYLERQVAKANQKQVPQSDVIDVFEHFLAVVWSGKGRKPALDAAKQKLIRARLQERPMADLKLAIAGLAKYPNVADPGGRCAPGKGKRYADLKHCLKDDDTCRRFIGYAEEKAERSTVTPIRREVRREVEPRSGEEFVDALVDLGMSVIRRHGYGASRWMATCPAHEDRDPSLSVTELNDGKILIRCFAGCEASAVLDVMGWTFPMLRGRS